MARVFIGTRVSNNGSIFSKSALRAGYINSITIILDVTAEAGRPPKFLFNRPRMAFPLTEVQMHGPKACGSSDTKSGRKGGVVGFAGFSSWVYEHAHRGEISDAGDGSVL